MRDDFDGAMCSEAIELVEQEMGRKVAALMTGHSIDTDHSVLCFVLAPADEEPDEEPCDDPGLGGTEPEPIRAHS